MNKFIIIVLMLHLGRILSDSCEKHGSCRECILDPSVCVWCSSKAYSNEQRCKSKELNSNNTWCGGPLEDYDGFAKEVEPKPFSSDPHNITQIKPQKYQMSLRPGQPQDFSFSFKWAEDYPVDMYFLFDSSFTMKAVRNETSRQSENIYSTMRNLTKNVYMGMGTFVDKNMLPYTLRVSKKLAYSFKHHVNLTQDYKKFQEAVDAIPMGENRDLPEAGLDALAQVIACKDKIGWRDQSRKILVLMTDDTFHAAGDGKSAGLFQPYDGKCYTENNVYTKELEMDYPSVGMINKMARDNNVIVIFAVARAKIGIYNSLSEYITGSKTMSLNAGKDNDIVTKLKEIYEKVTTKLKLNVNMQTDTNGGHQKNFKISFNPDCTQDISACNVTRNEIKEISATITLLEYDGYDTSTIDITMEGIAEKLTLDIDIINDCQCSKEAELSSDYCNKEKRECGVCQCKEPKYGDKCQCDRKTFSSDTDTSACRKNGTICSGQGVCNCGKCSCNQNFVGPYCECSLWDCPISAGHGVCGFGECQCDKTCKCNKGYSGPTCDCYDTDRACMANNKVCNNLGKCNCGKCECVPIAKWDSRGSPDKLCKFQPCDECHDLQCGILKDCATCLITNNIEKCDCSIVNDSLIYSVDEKLPEYVYNSEEDWHVCKKVRLEMGCYTNFTYKYDENEYKIRLIVQKDRNCAESHYIFGAIFLICLVLVGLLTLLGWKLLTYLQDRNEYMQFMKHHVPDSAPCANPLYEPATRVFRNPAFEERNNKK